MAALLLCAALVTAASSPLLAQDQEGADEAQPADEEEGDPSFWSKFKDPEDGQFDLGGAMGRGKGLLPILLPITEPALGAGAALIVAYLHPQDNLPEQPEGSVPIPPSISFIGAGGTSNGTRGGALGHLGVWNQGKTRYLGALFRGDVNLTFYGEGDTISQGLDWNLVAGGTYQELKFGLAKNFFLGGTYVFLTAKSSLDDLEETEIEPDETDSTLAGLGLAATYDARNTIFTPTRGLFADLGLVFYDETFGGDFNYRRLDLTLFKYWEFENFVLGARLEGSGVSDGAPFYGLPFLSMRGVPLFRYLGKYTAVVEAEPVWKITNRWRWLGFLAAGQAPLSSSDFGDVDTIVAGGTGFRYVLMRKLGLAVGLDVARGPEDTAVYFIIGSYWLGS